MSDDQNAAPLAIEREIERTRERLRESVAALAVRLEPATIAHRAQAAALRGFHRLTLAKPVAAALLALGAGVLLGTRKRRLYRRAELLQAAGMAVVGAVLTALLRGRPRRNAPILPPAAG